MSDDWDDDYPHDDDEDYGGEDPAAWTVCPSCRGEVDEEAAVCPHCGDYITPEIVLRSQTGSPLRTTLILLGIAATIIALSGLLHWL